MDRQKRLKGKIRTSIIGGFTVLGIGVLVWAIFFFKPKVGDNKNRLTVKFANVESIDVGTRVTYAGRPIGEVIQIDQIINARKKTTDSNGNPYSYQVVLALDSAIEVYSTDTIEIRTSGLLGEKSIAIIPQPINSQEPPKSVIGGAIYAQSGDPLASTLKTVSKAADEISQTMSQVTKILTQNEQAVQLAIENLNSTLQEASDLVFQANQLDILGTFNRAALDMSKFMNNANLMLDKVKDFNIIEKTDATIDNLAFITEKIADGKGTLGKLVNDPTLYLEAISTLDRVNQLIYDLNHYGLLFHRNRSWKQAQQARLEKVKTLKTPDAFTEQFQKEMSSINESLDKVNVMIEKADMGDEEIIDSNEFKKYFYNLLNEVNRLQNLIELYNQKITGP